MKSLSSVLALIVIFVSSAFAAQSDRITSAIDARTVEIPNHVRMQAQPKYDQGAVEPGFQMRMKLHTPPTPEQKAAIDKLLAAQQNPRSPMYHHWLTPKLYAERYGLNLADLDRLTQWLTAQGFKVDSVDKSRTYIVFSGTAAQVKSAFSTEIHRYNVNGVEHFANATNPLIPAAFAGIVTSIGGLDSMGWRPAHHISTMPSGSQVVGAQASRWRTNYYDPNIPFNPYLAPGDISATYDIKPLYTAGFTGHSGSSGFAYDIAVVGQTDVYAADLIAFRSGFGLPAITGCAANSAGVLPQCTGGNLSLVWADGVAPGISSGDLTESDLDLEWTNAVAPGANIVFVTAPFNSGASQFGVIDSYYYAISTTPLVAPVISMSYGTCELDEGANFAADDSELQMGASFGITFLVSSGDSAAAACDYGGSPNFSGLAQNGTTVSYPASSAYVLSIGGTAAPLAGGFAQCSSSVTTGCWGTTNAADGGSAVGYIPEQAWNDDTELATYCASNPGASFCAKNHITGQQSVQAARGMIAGGGGVSNCTNQSNVAVCLGGIPRPAWQPASFAVTSGQIGATKTRLVPDIAGMASPNFPGYIICVPQSELESDGATTSSCVNGIQTSIEGGEATQSANDPNPGQPYPQSIVGGTSASTPVYAGVVALLDEYLGGIGLGDIHIPLYQFAVSSPSAFHRVTTGDNTAYCTAGTPATQPAAIQCSTGILGFQASNFDATTGYNVVTGLGSLDVNNLAIAWSASRSGTTTGLLADHASIFQSQSVVLTATVTPPNATGSVTFYSGIAVLGTANVDNVGQAQLTTTALPLDSPAGTPDSITAKYNGDAFDGTSTSTAVTIDVVAAFTLAASGSAATTQGGTAGPITITPTPATGFTGNLTYSCTTTASEATCTASPNTAVNQSTPVSVSITTTAPQASLQFPGKGSGVFYALLLPGLLGLVLAGKGNRKGRTLMMLGFMAVLATSTMWMSACSSSSSTKNPGTPKGMYPVTVTATSGAISNTVTFQMTVN